MEEPLSKWVKPFHPVNFVLPVDSEQGSKEFEFKGMDLPPLR
jgi:hypothetical protein